MKKFLAILFGFFAFVALAVFGAALVMPEDDLAALIRPLPVVGTHTDPIVDFKADTADAISHFIDDTVYGLKSTWRDVTDISLTDRTQRVVIELEPVRTKKVRTRETTPAPAVTPPPPAPTPPEAGQMEPSGAATAPAPMAAAEPASPIASPAATPAEAMNSPMDTDQTVAPDGASGKTMAETNPPPEAPGANPDMAAATVSEKPNPVAEPETPKNMKNPDQAAAPPPSQEPARQEAPKEVAAVQPAAKAAPKPVRKPPPPAPQTDDGSEEHKKGLTYYKGLGGVTKNFKTAATWFLQSSEKGNAASQYNMGIMAYLGQGVEQSYAEAAKWFERAANQDHALAQYNLGFLYYEGKGVEKDDLQAFMWIDRAARLGDERAIKARDTLEEVLPKDILKNR